MSQNGSEGKRQSQNARWDKIKPANWSMIFVIAVGLIAVITIVAVAVVNWWEERSRPSAEHIAEWPLESIGRQEELNPLIPRDRERVDVLPTEWNFLAFWDSESLADCEQQRGFWLQNCLEVRKVAQDVADEYIASGLSKSEKAEWDRHYAKLNAIDEEMVNAGSSQFQCSQVKGWQADTRSALQFVQGLNRRSLNGTEYQLILRSRDVQELHKECIKS